MTVRSATEWRDLWRDRGEHELGLPPDGGRDTLVAERVHDWFEVA